LHHIQGDLFEQLSKKEILDYSCSLAIHILEFEIAGPSETSRAFGANLLAPSALLSTIGSFRKAGRRPAEGRPRDQSNTINLVMCLDRD
jgi:hypothetical protein